MNKIGYKILCEEVVLDRQKFYPVIVYEKGIERLNKTKLLYGTRVKIDDDYQNYLIYLKEKGQEKLNAIPKKYIIKRFFISKQIRFLSKNN